MNITLVRELKQQVAKLNKELENLPELKLSTVYDNGLAYGICYKDGHGTIEAFEVMENQPNRLLDQAQENAKDYVNGKLYIVGFKPVSIYAKIKN
jgi:hypothetical protein